MASNATGTHDANITQMRLIEALIENEISVIIRDNRTNDVVSTHGSIRISQPLTDINRADLEAFGYTVKDFGFMTRISWT